MDKPAQWALVGAAWFLALTVALIGFLAWRHFEATAGASTSALQGVEAPLQDGATAICPVTKERLTVTKDTPHLVYKERVFYFSKTLDAAGHEPKRLFLMDPEFYLVPGTASLTDKARAVEAALPQATPIPSQVPTLIPTLVSTVVPTLAPTTVPTPVPTLVPTSIPTLYRRLSPVVTP